MRVNNKLSNCSQFCLFYWVNKIFLQNFSRHLKSKFAYVRYKMRHKKNRPIQFGNHKKDCKKKPDHQLRIPDVASIYPCANMNSETGKKVSSHGSQTRTFVATFVIQRCHNFRTTEIATTTKSILFLSFYLNLFHPKYKRNSQSGFPFMICSVVLTPYIKLPLAMRL